MGEDNHLTEKRIMKFNWFKKKKDRCFVVFYSAIVDRGVFDGMTTVKEKGGDHFSALDFTRNMKLENPNYEGIFIRGFKEMTEGDEENLMIGLK